MNEHLNWLLDIVRDVDPIVRVLLAGVGILLETSILIGLVVPGDTVVIVASTATENATQFVAIVLTVVAGAVCGESVGFSLGRLFGPRIRSSRLGRWIGENNWGRAERYLARRGGLAVFLSRFLPVFHSLIPLTVGMSAMRYRTFIAWTTPACVVWATTYVTVGSLAAGSYRQLSQSLHFAGYIFVAIIVAFILLALLLKKLIGRVEARHMDAPETAPETERKR